MRFVRERYGNLEVIIVERLMDDITLVSRLYCVAHQASHTFFNDR